MDVKINKDLYEIVLPVARKGLKDREREKREKIKNNEQVKFGHKRSKEQRTL
jgi:hypothetical protein